MELLKKNKWFISAAIIIIIIGSVVYSFPYWVQNLYGFSFSNSNFRGTFGDLFGVLNTFFSGLAFALLIITSWMQSSELKIQRKELEDTRKEFEFNRLTNILYKQLDRFENIFRNEHEKKMLNNIEHLYSKIHLKDAAAKFLIEEKVYDILKSRTNTQALVSIFKKESGVFKALNDSIINSSLKQKDIDSLKSLFVSNIGEDKFLFRVWFYRYYMMKRMTPKFKELETSESRTIPKEYYEPLKEHMKIIESFQKVTGLDI